MAQGYVRAADLPQVIPVFPLPGAILLPRGQLPLNIFEPRYLNMIDDAMAGDRIIGMLQPQGGPQRLPGLSPIGCAGRITSFAETSDGRYLITLTGCARFRLGSEIPTQTPYRQIRADFVPFEADLSPPPVDDVGLDRDGLLDALRAYLEARGLDIDWDTAETAPPEALINSLSMALPFDPPEKQALLEAVSLTDRSGVLTALLTIDAAADGDGEAPSMQ
ncbi:MAG: LON peptidase substrate-binding domain-containing protein [Brevundimonas sp.]|uniref:LON peptidase substrate-binding domain-containing protein n=1 Tax=Brevundimonas sp. TaxID=1871086 RepID=UPI0027270BC5|nr:LON peptidase substrate-binding domain-containing protein [Brevundimonas sp.]MDO9076292.1 LON peptidase substrate-binding domain-containing protein [Brevundimonas sp.]MDP3079296.1 LON peptidase substrate-binding domain-containing protein [Brevundimonas sp.]MDZ4108995.1 LON peptidase substrate-binding domain-containing protein [Brevundimonas sp.]